MFIKKRINVRNRVGSVLGLVAISAVLMFLMGVLFFYSMRLMSGSNQLNNASDAGILNAAKQALVQPAVALNDSTLTNLNTLPYTDFAAFSDQSINNSPAIDLQTYNRCIAQAVIVSANALAINNSTALSNALSVCQAVQGLGKALQAKFTSQSISGPLSSSFSQLASANTLNMLGLNSRVTLITALTSAYVSNSKTLASSVWIDPSYLPGYNSSTPTSVLNQTNFKVPLATQANTPDTSSDPSAPAGSTWITGYSPIKIVLGSTTVNLYAVALSPLTTTHLIDSTRFNSSLTAPDANTPPNAFSSNQDTGNVSVGSAGDITLNGNVSIQAISCAIAGCNNNYNVASIPNGYIRIKNVGSATASGAPAVANVRYNASNSFFDLQGASKESTTAACFWVSPEMWFDQSMLGNVSWNGSAWVGSGILASGARLICNNVILMQEWYDFANSVIIPSSSWNGSQWVQSIPSGYEAFEGVAFDASKDPLGPYGTSCAALYNQGGINGTIPSQYLSGATFYWLNDNNLIFGTNPYGGAEYNLGNYGNPSLGNMLYFAGALVDRYSSLANSTQITEVPSAVSATTYKTNYDYKQNSVSLTSTTQIQRFMGYVSGQKTVNTADIRALVSTATNGGNITTQMTPLVDSYFDGTAPSWMIAAAQGMGPAFGYSIATASNSGDLSSYSIVRWLKLQVLSMLTASNQITISSGLMNGTALDSGFWNGTTSSGPMAGYVQGAVINMPYGSSGVATSGMMNYQRCGVNPDGSAANPNAYMVHYAEYGAMASVVGNDLATYTNVTASPKIESYGTPAQLLTQINETLNGPLPVTSTAIDNGKNSNYTSNTHTFNPNLTEFQTLMNALLQRCREIDPSFTLTNLYTALGWNNINGDPTKSGFYNNSAPTLSLGGTIYLYKNSTSGTLVCGTTLPIADTGLTPEGVGSSSGEVDFSTGYYAVCGDDTFASTLNSMVNVDQDGSATALYCGDAGVHRRPYLYQNTSAQNPSVNSICQAQDMAAYYPASGLNNFLGQITFTTSLRATSSDGSTVISAITLNGLN